MRKEWAIRSRPSCPGWRRQWTSFPCRDSTEPYIRANNILADGKTINELMGERSGAQAGLETLMLKVTASGPEGMGNYLWQEVITDMADNGITVDRNRASVYVRGLLEVNFQNGKRSARRT